MCLCVSLYVCVSGLWQSNSIETTRLEALAEQEAAREEQEAAEASALDEQVFSFTARDCSGNTECQT